MMALAAAVASIPLLVGPVLAGEGGYKLNPLDRISIKVAQWSATDRTMTPIEWLSGEHFVDAGGAVELPVVGEIMAEGTSVAELSDRILVDLRGRLGLVDDLFVSVGVVEFAPIFVVGAVQKPGEFEFRPGLRTLQAIALAGGVRRTSSLFSRTDREAVHSLGDHHLFEMDRWRALAKVARLDAELREAVVVSMPTELEGVPLAQELLDAETMILKARQDDYHNQIAAIDELADLVRARLVSLEKEKVLRQTILASTRDEVEAIASLQKRGLAATSRANETVRLAADIEARALSIETAILEAEQRASEAARDRVDIVGERRLTVVTELQTARAELNRATVKLQTADALFAEAARAGTTLSSLQVRNFEPTFVVTRSGRDGSATISADNNTLLLPGDVVEVKAPEIDNIPGLLPESDPSLSDAVSFETGAPTN